jgi:hypothetical protein
MLLGDADVEGAFGKRLAEDVDAGAAGIAAVIATILSSLRASSPRLSPEYFGGRRRVRLRPWPACRSRRRTSPDAVVLVLSTARGRVALPFCVSTWNEDRAFSRRGTFS